MTLTLTLINFKPNPNLTPNQGECYRGESCHFRHEWDEAAGEGAAAAST